MTIAQVQESTSLSGSGSSRSVTISTPGAGNTLFLYAIPASSGTISSVSGGGVTWTKVCDIGNGSLWAGPNSSGSGTTITLNVTNNFDTYYANCTEWSGMPASLTADGGSTSSIGSGTVHTTPTVTPTGTPVLLLAFSRRGGASLSSGPTNGFTAMTTTNGLQQMAYLIADPASGGYSTSWTYSFNITSGTGLYAFDGNSGGAAGQPTMRRFGGIDNANFRCGSEGVKMWRAEPKRGELLLPDRSLVIPQPEMRIAN